MILRAVPEAQVDGSAGRRGSFEVTLNGKQIYSKLATSAFPTFERVVEQTELARKGEDTAVVTEGQASSCQIL
jgi:selenoprotein W-related protein